jgi:hypothetical protein
MYFLDIRRTSWKCTLLKPWIWASPSFSLPPLRMNPWVCRQVPKSGFGFGHFQPAAVLEHGTEVRGGEGVAEDAARTEGCGR